jgi:predicted ATPase
MMLLLIRLLFYLANPVSLIFKEPDNSPFPEALKDTRELPTEALNLFLSTRSSLL